MFSAFPSLLTVKKTPLGCSPSHHLKQPLLPPPISELSLFACFPGLQRWVADMFLIYPAEECVNWVFPVVKGYDLCYPGAPYFGHISCFQEDVLLCLLCVHAQST